MRRAAFLTFLLFAPGAWGERLTPGHQAELLTSGQRSFAKRFENIRDADIVMMKTYQLEDDETGSAMIEALRQRALAGKKVFLEYDVKGSATGSSFGLVGNALGIGRALPAFIQPLVDAGGTVVRTNMPTLGSPLFGRDHDKLLVTWKEGEPVKVIMGGMNVGNSYAWAGNWGDKPKPKRGYRDTDIQLTGPETSRIVQRFWAAASQANPGHETMLAIWNAAARINSARGAFEPQAGPHSADIRFYSNDPKGGSSRHTIEALYERLIDETPTGETVTIANAYTLLTPRLQKAVVLAIKRGVKFHAIVNTFGAEQSEASSLGYAFRDQLRTLFDQVPAGSIQVTEFAGNDRRNEGEIHQKIARFGKTGPVVVGSHNLDSISANFNAEAVAVVRGHRVSQQFDALINRMMREGKTNDVDKAGLAKDPALVKAKGWALHRVVGKVL